MVCEIESAGLTQEFYLLNSGGCRRAVVVKRGKYWRFDEYPYGHGIVCQRAGKHPHAGLGGYMPPSQFQRPLKRLNKTA